MKFSLNVLFIALTFGISSCTQKHETPNLGIATIEKGRSRAISSHAPTIGSNADRIKTIKPGETVEIANIKGPAIINHIWLTFNESRPNWLEPDGSANPSQIVLRMYWDDAGFLGKQP